VLGAFELSEQSSNFITREDSWQTAWAFSPFELSDLWEFLSQHVAIQKEQGVQGHVLG
jgi:hypothetical protein